MQAVILAAGMGKRLGSLTEKDTKCMVSVLGKRLIDRTLEALAAQKKEGTPISRIVMVVGFGRERLREYLGEEFEGTPILYIENEEYNMRIKGEIKKILAPAIKRALPAYVTFDQNRNDTPGALFKAWGLAIVNQMKGAYYEFGVYQGESFRESYRIYQEYAAWGQAFIVHLS